MDKNDSSSMHEEASLSEESDGSSEGAFNANDAMLVALQSLNKNMTEMGASLRSLKEKGETQIPTMAVPTTKRYLPQKSPSTGDNSNTEESDADVLLATNRILWGMTKSLSIP